MGGRFFSRAVTRAIASASPGSLLPGRRVRRRSTRLRCGGTSRTASLAFWADLARGAPYDDEPSTPIVTSGAIARAQAMNARWPAGSLANVSSPTGRPSSSTAQAASVGLVGVDTDRRHVHASASEFRWTRVGWAGVRSVTHAPMRPRPTRLIAKAEALADVATALAGLHSDEPSASRSNHRTITMAGSI